jgi:alpha-beta hydrolase superfamily lysophospholipase
LADAVIWTFTASDGYRWHYRHYPPAQKPTARVVCLHGIQSHGDWYEASCQHLRDAGADVYFLDRRGSGLNAEARGDTPSFRRLFDDVGEFLQTLRGPGSPPLIVSAISWGGKLGAGLCYRFPSMLDGLALLAPGFCPRVRPPTAERLEIARAAVTSPNRLFPIPLNDPALFTATADWQKFIADDPLSLREATARFLVESLKLDMYLRRVPRHVTIPVLLQLAGEDRIIDNSRTRRYVERFAAQRKDVIEYPGAHHTLEFEQDPRPVFDDLTGWIRRVTDHFSPKQ